MTNYKKYNNIKLIVGITKGVISFSLLLLFVITGYSTSLVSYLSLYISNNYILFLGFTFITGFTASLIFAPVNFYKDFYLEHKYNLSNQTLLKWIWENFKGLLVSILIGSPILLFFFYSLNNFGSLWWLPFAVGLFLISVILGRIAPVLILPLFFKVTAIEDEDLKARIENLAKDAGMKVENVYKFNMSKNTKKANAAFTGIGKAKRILLADTLIANYSREEIETIVAHELGHYKKKHIVKNILIGTVSSFLTLFLVSSLYSTSLHWFGFKSIGQISALPVLSLWGMLIGIIQTPISNILSRKFEFEADEYAISSTGLGLAFISTLEKLTEQNLADKDPHPFIEWFFYSHPSINNRISAIMKLISQNENSEIQLKKKELGFEGN